MRLTLNNFTIDDSLIRSDLSYCITGSLNG